MENNNNTITNTTNGIGSSNGINIKTECIEVHTDLSSPQTQNKLHMVTTTTTGSDILPVVSVPVSAVCTTYNVITQDQLPTFKQMLCVDNNYLPHDMNADIKTIVIQQDQHMQQSTQNDINGSGGSNHSQDGSLLNDSSSSSNNLGGTLATVATTGGAKTQNHQSQQNPEASLICPELLNTEVIPIRCKTTNADLYKNKLGSGGRGRCIKCRDTWYSPSEFETICGRGSSKDWKRSIRYGGRSLQALIDAGIITPHATNCSCSACTEDEQAATGPVRLFTPYKRRKRNQVDQELDSAKKKRNGIVHPHTIRPALAVSSTTLATATITSASPTTNIGGISGTIRGGATIAPNPATTLVNPGIATNATAVGISPQHEHEEIINFQNEAVSARNRAESWPNLNDSLDETTVEFFDTTNTILDTNPLLKQLESAYSSMIRATSDFKKIFLEYRENCTRKIEQLQNEKDLLASRLTSDLDDPNIANVIAGNEIVSPKKCANCNRDALAECSLCRSTPYCSIFCQRKDWNSHQVQCNREPIETTTQQIMLLVDDQS